MVKQKCHQNPGDPGIRMDETRISWETHMFPIYLEPRVDRYLIYWQLGA